MFKKLFFILLFSSIVSVGLAYYFFNQATQVPEWYETQEKNSKPKINVQDLSNIQSAQAAITNKIEQQVKSQNNTYQKENVNIRLNQQELNQLVLVAIAENYQQRQLLEAAETIQTKI